MMVIIKRTYRVAEVAEILGCSGRTVYRLMERGAIKGSVRRGRVDGASVFSMSCIRPGERLEDRYMGLKEAAVTLRVSRSTVLRWLVRGNAKLRKSLKGYWLGRRVLVERESVREMKGGV